MELIAASILCAVALFLVWMTNRNANDRCERAEGTLHSIVSVNRDLVGAILKQGEDANERFAKVCGTLIEVSECAPGRTQLEQRRQELQYEVEIERLQRLKKSESTSRGIESLAEQRVDHGMTPVSQSMIED